MIEPKNTHKLELKLELLWWVFTGIVAFAVIFPILQKLTSYPFLIINVVYIIWFITLTRTVFLLKHSFLANKQMVKAAIVLSSVPIIFILANCLTNFQTYMDETTFDQFMTHLPLEEQKNMNKYIHAEMVLFGVGSIIISIIFPFRMILSIWRNRNTNKVWRIIINHQ